jgi:hypothetical protein
MHIVNEFNGTALKADKMNVLVIYPTQAMKKGIVCGNICCRMYSIGMQK